MNILFSDFTLVSHIDERGITIAYYRDNAMGVADNDNGENMRYFSIIIEYPAGYPLYEMSKVYVAYTPLDQYPIYNTAYLIKINRELFNEFISPVLKDKIRPFEFGGVKGKRPTFEELPFI